MNAIRKSIKCDCSLTPDETDATALKLAMCQHHFDTITSIDELADLSRSIWKERDDAKDYEMVVTPVIGRVLLPSTRPIQSVDGSERLVV